MELPIYQVDAFAHRPFSGNPAAVCLLGNQAVEDDWMQQLAAEMNLSETAFLTRRSNTQFGLRWFTPATEVDLCGHATLASAHILWEQSLVSRQDAIQFETRSGQLETDLRGERIEMNFPAQPATPTDPPAGLLDALGAEATYVGRNQADYLVEVDSQSTLLALRPNFPALAEVEARGVIVTALAEQDDIDFCSRFFAPRVLVDEDPVTGSAHCCLAPHWAAKLNRTELLGYQASQRGGYVSTQLQGERVVLAGQAVTILRGTLAV